MGIEQITEGLGVSIQVLALGAFIVLAWTAGVKKEFEASGRWCYVSNLIPAGAFSWYCATSIQQGVILTIIWAVGSAAIWQLFKDGIAKIKGGS